MEQKSTHIGVIGLRTDSTLSMILSHLFPNASIQPVEKTADATMCDEMYVSISYPHVDPKFVQKIKDISKKKITAIVLDTLAISEMSKVIGYCDSIICFSQEIRCELITRGFLDELIKVTHLRYSFSDKKEYTKDKKIRLLIPAKGIKNTHADTIIGLAYKLRQSNLAFEIICFGSERDTITGGFSKYFLDSISQKGFNEFITPIKQEFTSHSVRSIFEDATYTLILNATEQNQFDVLSTVLYSLHSQIPVIMFDKLSQFSSVSGVCNVSQNAHSENSLQSLFERVTSDALHTALVQDIQSNGVIVSDTIDQNKAPAIISSHGSRIRVLMQNRNNAFIHPGGDTVVMQKIYNAYDRNKIDIDVCVDGSKNPSEYDLIHLFNFAIREVTEQQARQAHEAGVPYVVTTLYEDWPLFYNQMANMYLALKTYVDHNQPNQNWIQYEEAGKQVAASDKWDNSFAANHAHTLVATGNSEINALTRDYPRNKNCISIPLGCEVTNYFDGGELFRKTFGITDFVLCVGRLEWRKNQLMLLKALEDLDIPIVFAASSFTYQPEYEALCKSFSRRGKTHFIGRLTDEELASAYQAARVHALPSWFELPGLVSLEAARYGTPIVVSDNGTIRDYVGKHAFYCKPNNAESIKNAVLNAYHSARNKDLQNHVEQFTWQKTADMYSDLYLAAAKNTESALSQKDVDRLKMQSTSTMQEIPSDNSSNIITLDESIIVEELETPTIQTFSAEDTDYCVIGDSYFKSGKFEEAKNAYEKDITSDARMGRAYRSLGALDLYLKNYSSADMFFSKALSVDQFDAKALLGKGAILWEREQKEEAFALYRQASDLKPNDQSALLYLVNSAYELKKLDVLENSLRRYLRENPSHIHIQYCLAGCYYKQEKFSAALGVLERLFTLDSDHQDGKELKELIESKLSSHTREGDALGSQIEVITVDDNQKQDIIECTENKISNSGTKEIQELEELKATRQYQQLIDKVELLRKDIAFNQSALDHFEVLRGEAYGCLGEIETAREILSTLRLKDVQPGRVLCDLGALDLAMSSVVSASELFEEALRYEPKNDNAFAGLAMCAQQEGRLEDAWTLFEESLRKNPQNIQAIYGLVQLGYEFNRLDTVEKFLREYLELKPIDISILYSLAGCLYAQGKSEEAVGELRNILLFDPKNEPALELIEKINYEEQAHN